MFLSSRIASRLNYKRGTVRRVQSALLSWTDHRWPVYVDVSLRHVPLDPKVLDGPRGETKVGGLIIPTPGVGEGGEVGLPWGSEFSAFFVLFLASPL